MKGLGLFAQLGESIQTFWLARDARERKMLAAAILICMFGAIYALAIDPALTGRTLLKRDLPRLRQQAAQMRQLSSQATQLAAMPKTSSAPLTRSTIEASLKQAGLNAAEIVVSDRNVRLQFSAAPFDVLLGWLEQMQAQQLFASDVDIALISNTNTAKATISLVQRQEEQQ
jgi:general secretion pathway protein M